MLFKTVHKRLLPLKIDKNFVERVQILNYLVLAMDEHLN